MLCPRKEPRLRGDRLVNEDYWGLLASTESVSVSSGQLWLPLSAQAAPLGSAIKAVCLKVQVPNVLGFWSQAPYLFLEPDYHTCNGFWFQIPYHSLRVQVPKYKVSTKNQNCDS